MGLGLETNKPGSVKRATFDTKFGLCGSYYWLVRYVFDCIKKDQVCNGAVGNVAQSVECRNGPVDVRKTVGCPVWLAFDRTICNRVSNDQYF